MKAITVRQPWARCVAIGAKNVENRGRATAYRGPLAIHAAKAPDVAGDRDERVRRLYGEDPRLGAPVGAVATLADCHQASPIWPTCCGEWAEPLYGGKPAWHLVLEGAVLLDHPVYARGEVRVPWELPEDVAVKVQAQLDQAGVR